ncbi:MAG: hypothetical protein PHH82_00005 [Candidatus ainarchaeum sp.]|nr:hypothetical protein [Candidatus ainarchaeum sp.]
MNKGFFVLYFVILAFLILLTIFFVYSHNSYKEQKLIEDYITYSNVVTDQTILENNVSFFIKKTIEKGLLVTQNRSALKLAYDAAFQVFLLSEGFDTSNFKTELLIEVVSLGLVDYINYQYVFLNTLENKDKKVLISQGAVYSGQVIV